MMGDRKKTRYLGALVAICALGAFAGTAVADDSATLATGADAQEAVVEPASNDTESVTAAEEGVEASADAPAALEADSESTESSPEGGTTTSGDANEESTNETTTSTPTETNGDSEPGPATTTNDVTTTNESGGEGDCSPEGLVFGNSLAVGSSSATATFSVRSGCAGVLVTLVSYAMPKAQYSFPQQFFASSDGMFAGGGTYSLTVPLPSCFFQIDLIRGPAPGAITGSGQPSQGLLRAALSSPNKVCDTTTTTTTTTTTPTTSTETTTTTPTTSTETTTTTPTTTTETTTPTTTESSTPSTGVAGTGATKGNSSLLGGVAAAANLPFTGLSLALVAVIGLDMLLIGICIRLAARQRRGIGRHS